MVEFCGHIIFHNSKSVISCPIQRATHSCVEVGSSVILPLINYIVIVILIIHIVLINYILSNVVTQKLFLGKEIFQGTYTTFQFYPY